MAKCFEQIKYILELSQEELNDLYECVVDSDYTSMVNLSDEIVAYVERTTRYNSEQLKNEIDLPF